MTPGRSIVALLILVIGFQAGAQVSADDVYRAAQENQARLLKTIHQLKNEKSQQFSVVSNLGISSRSRQCDDDVDSDYTCVPKCNVRGSSGSCLTYGSDFCGENVNCVERCSVRVSSGNCISYAGDYCGERVSCHEVCNVRGSSGDCLSYGADQCY